MKTNLFYFSATGNSFAIAKDLAAKLPGAQIFAMPRVINGAIDLSADSIGLVFPVYFEGLPRLVIDFINRLEPDNVKYWFAVCTCGGFPMGTLRQTQNQLKSRGITLNAGFSIRMPGNYLLKYGAFPLGMQQKILKKAAQKIDAIAATVQHRQNNAIGPNNRFINSIGEFFYQSMFPKFPTLDRNFTVSAKCSGCNLCEKVCPVGNIKMAANGPAWGGNCEHCLACIQWCPTEAIQYGNKTAHRKRYHHPGVTASELYREP